MSVENQQKISEKSVEIDWQQCEEPIRCLFVGDDACYELAWMQHEYCKDAQPPVSYPEHVPVDTSGDASLAYMADFPGTVGTVLQCGGMLLAFFGVSFLIVGCITYIKDLFDRDQDRPE